MIAAFSNSLSLALIFRQAVTLFGESTVSIWRSGNDFFFRLFDQLVLDNEKHPENELKKKGII